MSVSFFESPLFFWLKRKPKTPHEGPYYADIYARGIAAAIDLSLLYMVLRHPFNYVERALFQHIVTQSIYVEVFTAPDILTGLSYLWHSHWVYFFCLNCLFQLPFIALFMLTAQCLWNTTPGKWLLAIRIVDAKTLQPPAKWRYFVRFLAYIPSCLSVVGFYWMGVDKRNRGLHDIIAGTVVIHRYPRGWVLQQVKRGIRRLFRKPADK